MSTLDRLFLILFSLGDGTLLEDGTTAAGETSDKKNQVEAELRRECSTDEILA